MAYKCDIKINAEKIPLDTDQGIIESEEKKWGMPLKEVFRHGLCFYKDKEGKAMHLSYEDRLKLVAYTQQAAHGPFETTSASPLGVFDVIGRDRRAAWQALGHMSQIQAMTGFIHSLDRLCPLFKPYLEAIQKDLENKKQQEMKIQEERRALENLHNRVLLEKQKQHNNVITEEQQIQRIKDALNAQTYDQFLEYAQQQFPGNFDQQAILIRQLQDQHYQQYIQQLAVDKRLANSNIKDIDNVFEKENDTSNITEKDAIKETKQNGCISESETTITDQDNNKITQAIDKSNEYVDELHGDSESRDEEDSDGEDILPPIEEARMWTSKDIVQFKESALQNGGKLIVGHGETVTIRVPTHNRARCLCWEFATDNYDIGFGLYFEWNKSSTSEVTIHVSESDEDDDPDDDEVYEDYAMKSADPELGSEERTMKNPKPFVSLVMPIYRRDCHEAVYAGSHNYPGEGVYLLKFDNTYSLWRSKTLYYKVYYTQ